MKRTVHQTELVWAVVVGLIIWNIWLTFRTSSQTIVSLDMVKVVRTAAQSLADASEGDDLELAKDKLAKRLRSVVQTYANKHKVIVVDATTIIAGETRDITAEVIKEVKR